MAAQFLKLAGKRFVLLPEMEYRKLRGDTRGKAKTAAGRSRKHRMTRQDWGDVAEAKRRANEPIRPYSELRKDLGLA